MRAFPFPSFRHFVVFLCAIATVAGSSSFAGAQSISYTNFANTSGLTLNGTAAVNGNALELTDGRQFEAGSFFYNTRQNVSAFQTDFEFQLTNAVADGFAFVLQCDGPDFLGENGAGLGVATYNGPTIPSANSIAIAFGLHPNYGDSGNTLRLLWGGEKYAITELGPSGIDLHSGHRFRAHIAFSDTGNGGYMQVTLTDLQTNKIFTGYLPSTQFEGFHITAAVAETSTYVGFTGATGQNTAIQSIYNWTFTSTPVAGQPTSPGPSFLNGFAGATQLYFNGAAALSGPAIQLTNGGNFEATSVYFNQKLAPQPFFFTDFDFQIENGTGDGFTFVLQDQGLTAVGSSGGGLGYGPDHPGGQGNRIGNSLAVKFDTHNNAGEGINSIFFYTNGASPTTPSLNLAGSGINLQSGHPFHVRIANNYGVYNVTIVDLQTYKLYFQTFLFDASYYQPVQGYAGFTAGTGATPSSIKIFNWTWNQVVPIGAEP